MKRIKNRRAFTYCCVPLQFLLLVLLSLYSCDFFDTSDQPMGTGDTDLLNVDWDHIDSYITCSLYLKPDETGRYMSAEFIAMPRSSISDFVDLSSTTFDMGGQGVQVPISTLQLVHDTVSTRKVYRTTYDSLPFFIHGDRVAIRLISPYWGTSEESIAYPTLFNIYNPSNYFDSTGEFVDTITFNLSLDYATSGSILKKTYVTLNSDEIGVDSTSAEFDRYDDSLSMRTLSEYSKSSILSIDSIGIAYAVTHRGDLDITGNYSGYTVQTQLSKEFIIKPNKRNK